MGLERHIIVCTYLITLIKSIASPYDRCFHYQTLMAVGMPLKKTFHVRGPGIESIRNISFNRRDDYVAGSIDAIEQQSIHDIRMANIVIRAKHIEPLAFRVANAFVERIVDSSVRFRDDFKSWCFRLQFAQQLYCAIFRCAVINQVLVLCLELRHRLDTTNQPFPVASLDAIECRCYTRKFHIPTS